MGIGVYKSEAVIWATAREPAHQELTAMKRRFEVTVEQPCDVPWDGMSPKARSRFCDRCVRSVHDLASMPPQDVEQLALRSAAGELVCARVTRDGAGHLVMLETGSKVSLRGAVILSTALAFSLPAAAQQAAETTSGSDAAILRGTLRRPDGSPVNSGLIQLLARSKASLPVWVADEIGNFEVQVPAGEYDLTVQTGAHQARTIGSVELHDGPQSVGEVLTQNGAKETIEMMPLLGTMSVTAGRSIWSPRIMFRHPVLFTRAMVRRLR